RQSSHPSVVLGAGSGGSWATCGHSVTDLLLASAHGEPTPFPVAPPGDGAGTLLRRPVLLPPPAAHEGRGRGAVRGVGARRGRGRAGRSGPAAEAVRPAAAGRRRDRGVLRPRRRRVRARAG